MQCIHAAGTFRRSLEGQPGNHDFRVPALKMPSLGRPWAEFSAKDPSWQGTCGLVAMTSASRAEGRQFDPGQVYFHTSKVSGHIGNCEN